MTSLDMSTGLRKVAERAKREPAARFHSLAHLIDEELLAGAFFVEYIFGWKGIGKVTVDALEKLDFPVVMGSVLVSSFFFIGIGLLADLLYGLVDPRVRVI